MTSPVPWDPLLTLLRQHHRFVLSTHVHPDGDAIGSLIGLALFLDTLGKETLLINDDPVPRIYRFLDPDGRIRQYEPERDDADIAACDAAFVLDVGALDRVGTVGQAMQRHRTPTACIDHHATNDGFADVDIVVPDAPSTTSLILDLIHTMGRAPTPEIAQALFCGLATDTGWFRFANATPRAFHAATDLARCGIHIPQLYERIYEDLTWARTHLLSRMLHTLRSAADDRIAYAAMTTSMFEETGAVQADVEGFVDKMREIGGVEIIILFRERPEGGTRVSFRSKHNADVGSLAAALGGGGHRRAAGATVDTPLAETVETVLASAQTLLDT
ncbi:DHH family phosphoesterase [bacterium]|nr:DHH family phosphoesterase [bacterium]